jgi:hypothetical protein
MTTLAWRLMLAARVTGMAALASLVLLGGARA